MNDLDADFLAVIVAPFTGAWIEIRSTLASMKGKLRVAPFTGAWIEIPLPSMPSTAKSASHPSRVRGLKWIPRRWH